MKKKRKPTLVCMGYVGEKLEGKMARIISTFLNTLFKKERMMLSGLPQWPPFGSLISNEKRHGVRHLSFPAAPCRFLFDDAEFTALLQ
ncbi:hypothetical protein HanRHA438_Chr11g0495401 [Helianthus annuus]|nr:hypothetical protein HanRHA438_Chr11g0495401 [Helianthus annuus]